MCSGGDEVSDGLGAVSAPCRYAVHKREGKAGSRAQRKILFNACGRRKKAGNVPAGKERVTTLLLRCVLIEQQQLRVLRGGRQDGGHGLLGLGDVHPCAGRVGHVCGGLYGRQPMYQKLFAGWH